MKGDGGSDEEHAGAASPHRMEVATLVWDGSRRRGEIGGGDLTPLESPGGGADDDMFANFV